MGSTEVPLHRPAGASSAKIVVLHFSVSYWTKWGQTVVVLGSWDEASKRGHRLACRHAGEGVLVWEARISVPLSLQRISYKYAVVNDASEIEVEEGGARKVALPAAIQDSAVIELQDVWQVDVPFIAATHPPAVTAPCKATEGVLQYNSTQQELCKHCAEGCPVQNTFGRTQDPSQPASVLSRSAFRGNILANKSPVNHGKVARMECAEEEVVVRFRLW